MRISRAILLVIAGIVLTLVGGEERPGIVMLLAPREGDNLAGPVLGLAFLASGGFFVWRWFRR